MLLRSACLRWQVVSARRPPQSHLYQWLDQHIAHRWYGVINITVCFNYCKWINFISFVLIKCKKCKFQLNNKGAFLNYVAIVADYVDASKLKVKAILDVNTCTGSIFYVVIKVFCEPTDSWHYTECMFSPISQCLETSVIEYQTIR